MRSPCCLFVCIPQQLLETSIAKEGAVGEQRYVCRLLGTSSLMEGEI